jgi:Cd2+/Zn2+-exporting ATPase
VAKSVRQIPGVLLADLNFASGLLLLEYDRGQDPRARAVGVVIGAGHNVESLDDGGGALPGLTWWSRHRADVTVTASGALILLGWLLGLLDAGAASDIVYALAIVVGGTITWRRAATSLMARSLDMNVLMTVAVSGAAALGEWGEGATVIFLFALGGLLEARSLTRTRRSLRDLMDLARARARVLRDGAELEVAPTEVVVGETLVVRPGERVPLDGEIVRGDSAFDESPITGESLPVDKGVGDAVYAGTLNASGLVEVRTTAPASDTMLARIVHLVEAAQASRAPVQRFVDRFSRIYTPVVLAGAVALAIGGPVLGELGLHAWGFAEWDKWAYQSLVLLVVSCPCALVVSTPVAIVSGITRATRDGVLVKGGVFLELAGKVSAVVFDKTGTLTEGRPVVAATVALGNEPAERILTLAAALESHSNHPLAAAVVAAAPGGALFHVSELHETPGRGVSGIVDGDLVTVGSVTHASDIGVVSERMDAEVERLESEGLTVLAVVAGENPDIAVLGLIGIADAVRSHAADVVRELRLSGIEHVVMLTGDNPRAAARVAAEAGITEFRAHLLPEDKTAAVNELRERHGVVAMVGDGINDAPALAVADIGIAMGAAGSHTAIETADVALMRDDLFALPLFLRLGRSTMANIRQNVVLSLGVKVIVLVLAVFGYASLWMAVFADTGVALIVIANGLRLLRKK